MTDAATIERNQWPLRPVLLAALGAAAAWSAWALTDQVGAWAHPPLPAWRGALTVAVLTGALGFGIAADRVRIVWTIVFAVGVGALAGLIFYWSGSGGRNFYEWLWDWRSLSLFAAVAIAAPLFQTARDEGAARWPYAEVHSHAWTNVVLWFACWVFVGVTMVLVYLLSELFGLIKLKFLHDLLDHGWFVSMLVGAAFGTALGLFRERDRVVRLLQFVVTAVSSVLAPVLAAGLGIFLLALPFTGLVPLWEATRSTTPILMSCVIGAVILCNAVIGNGMPEDEPRHPVLRWAALALAVEMFPLTLVAAVATGLRIGQYGLTPDRLWALIFVVIASAYGIAYFVSVVRSRTGWAERARPANLILGFGLCGIALLLATPLISFNALSTRDQVARLESGKIAPERFDWAALAYDFGDPGRAAVRRLATSARPAIAKQARVALAAKSRWNIPSADSRNRNLDLATQIDRFPLIVRPTHAAVPVALRRAAFGTYDEDFAEAFVVVDDNDSRCSTRRKAPCQLFWTSGASTASLLQDECGLLPPAKRVEPGVKCTVNVGALKYVDGSWRDVGWARRDRPKLTPAQERASLIAERAAIERGDIAIRTVTRRQLFVGDKPQGQVFE